jgi:Putative zinc-finger
MQEFEPLKSTALGPCPSAEDLAAYIEGTLDAKENARITEHLASCGECYAVYMESLQFERESWKSEPVGVLDGEILPFRSKSASSAAVRWLSIAALLLVGIGGGGALGFQFLAPLPEVVASRIAPPLRSLPNGAEPLWLGPTFRGGSGNEEIKLDEAAFRMGVQVVNLQVTLKADKTQDAEDVVARILGLLKPQPFSDDLQKGYTGITLALVNGRPPVAMVDEAMRLAKVYRKDFEPGTAFELGQWVEAGQLAAQLRDPSFFQQAATSSFLRRLRWRDRLHSLPGIKDAELDSVTRESLAQVAGIVSKGNLQPSDYDELKRQLDKVLVTYYPMQ